MSIKWQKVYLQYVLGGEKCQMHLFFRCLNEELAEWVPLMPGELSLLIFVCLTWLPFSGCLEQWSELMAISLSHFAHVWDKHGCCFLSSLIWCMLMLFTSTWFYCSSYSFHRPAPICRDRFDPISSFINTCCYMTSKVLKVFKWASLYLSQ